MNRKIILIGALILILALGVEFVVITAMTRQTADQVLSDLETRTQDTTPIVLTSEAPQSTPDIELPISLSSPYSLPVSLGNLGSRLVELGAIDLKRFLELYERSGNPLSAEQQAMLTEPSNANLVADHSNAHFLLNLLWALGLTNKNRILSEGPMMTYSEGRIERFASTGGWTIGKKTVTELYASEDLISLNTEQQLRLEHVTHRVFRPCCNNPTDFPDCNHGMAMLGLLELLAAADSTEDEMFAAAKAMNAIWFPAQNTELALYAEHALETTWENVTPDVMVGPELASGTGFQNVHQWLATNNLLPTLPGGGDGCGL